MTELTDTRHLPNLTALEIGALDAGINVADGHARQEPTSSQWKIIDQLPELYAQALAASATALDREAQTAFLSALGQHSALTGTEVLSCYSSSVAMEIFARALQAVGLRRVALIHPTFDNIPDILLGVGVELVPVTEEQLIDGAALPPGVDVLFITTPNNPTGRVLPRDRLVHWAQACAANNLVLALDTSFRGFDDRAQYDHYAVLAEAGCAYVVIEDTGKLWPTLDLKVGFLVFRPGGRLPLRRIYTDILLGVSPLILLLVRHLAHDAQTGGLADLHRFISANRVLLRGQLADLTALSFPDPDSRVSVERVLLPAGTTGTDMWRRLSTVGVHLLPCRQFHWADPAAGDRFVRVALGRPPDAVRAAAAAIRTCVAGP